MTRRWPTVIAKYRCALLPDAQPGEQRLPYAHFLDTLRRSGGESGHRRGGGHRPPTRSSWTPASGFGKTYEQNLAVIHHLEELNRFGLPILLGTSRKSVIGLTLDLPAEERMEGTLVTTVMAVEKGCCFCAGPRREGERPGHPYGSRHSGGRSELWIEIRIDDLRFFAHHGVFDFETEQGQNFVLSVVMETDTRRAGKERRAGGQH